MCFAKAFEYLSSYLSIDARWNFIHELLRVYSIQFRIDDIQCVRNDCYDVMIILVEFFVAGVSNH